MFEKQNWLYHYHPKLDLYQNMATGRYPVIVTLHILPTLRRYIPYIRKQHGMFLNPQAICYTPRDRLWRVVTWIPHSVLTVISVFNTYNAAGVSRRHVQNLTNISKNSKSFISLQYLESSWKTHSNKYKHAWYWFSNSWNRLLNLRLFGK